MDTLRKVLEIASYVVLPLAWGLAVNAVFGRFRKNRAENNNSTQ